MKDLVALSNRIVAAYNAKDFDTLKSLIHPDLDFSHVNRGFSYSKRDDLIAVLQMFAKELMPDRQMGKLERSVVDGNVIVRVAGWGGTARADIPGFGSAGDKIGITICSIMRFDDAGLLVEWKDFG